MCIRDSWNADGDFDDLDEIIGSYTDNGAGTYAEGFIDLLVPDHAVIGSKLGFRARLSHQSGLTPYGPAPEGEVEDYLIMVEEHDICLPLVIIIGGN